MRIIIPLFLLLLGPVVLPARTWVVAPGTELSAIQAAIDRAAAFDTVLVQTGEYREGGITVKKPLTLLGAGWPVLDGEHRYQPLSIRSNRVSVSGFKVIRCGRQSLEDQGGIKVYNARYVYIFNNILDDNYFGIYLSASKLC